MYFKGMTKDVIFQFSRMPVSAANRYLLLYGSQTGQAKAIAEEIAERSTAEGLAPDLHCLSTTEKKVCLITVSGQFPSTNLATLANCEMTSGKLSRVENNTVWELSGIL